MNEEVIKNSARDEKVIKVNTQPNKSSASVFSKALYVEGSIEGKRHTRRPNGKS